MWRKRQLGLFWQCEVRSQRLAWQQASDAALPAAVGLGRSLEFCHTPAAEVEAQRIAEQKEAWLP